jgi:hypothetical protein
MTIMNVQLCIAVTYCYDYFEAKLVPNTTSPRKPPTGLCTCTSLGASGSPQTPFPR